MRIIQFTAENVKKLHTVEITPAGNVVQITGPNGSGKTSVLDSILWALAGTREMQTQPIRRGETTAKIQLDLGTEGAVELKVTRTITEDRSTVTVESADGARYKAPQAMIDKILGAIALDPLEFTRQKPREQFDTIRTLVNVDIDFEKFDGLQRGDAGRRTDMNRDLKKIEAQVDAIADEPGEIPPSIDTAELVEKISDAGQHNADRQRTLEARETAKIQAGTHRDNAAKNTATAERLRKEAEEFEAAAAKCITAAEDLEKKLANVAPLSEPVDVAELKRKLTAANVTNAALEQRRTRKKQRDALNLDLERLTAEADKITHRIAERERKKNEAIAAAEMPIAGIGFGDGVVLLNGLPFDQASGAEQLRASAAIAMAANPKLRVLRIKDGSLLDDAGLKLLEELAAAKDYQIWIERVDTSGSVGFVMEEGTVHRSEGEQSRPPSPTGSAPSTPDTLATSPPVVPVEDVEQLLEDLEHAPDTEDPYKCPDCDQLTEEAGEPCLLCRNGITATKTEVLA